MWQAATDCAPPFPKPADEEETAADEEETGTAFTGRRLRLAVPATAELVSVSKATLSSTGTDRLTKTAQLSGFVSGFVSASSSLFRPSSVFSFFPVLLLDGVP